MSLNKGITANRVTTHESALGITSLEADIALVPLQFRCEHLS
jgi:hypothetical protein